MSPVPCRRLVSAGSLSLALALASPLAAFADSSSSVTADAQGEAGAGAPGASGDHTQASGAAAPRTQEVAPTVEAPSEDVEQKDAAGRSDETPVLPSQAANGNGSDAAQGSNAGQSNAGGNNGGAGQGNNAGQGSEAGNGGGQGSEAGNGGGQGNSGQDQQDDPAGNNGTVKIDGVPVDGGRANEPHVDCAFQIEFFGFDEGDRADILLTGQAPSRGGVLYSDQNVLISNDAAGGGQDVDEVIALTIDDLDLSRATPHPKQGYHVKLSVDVEGAPGGAKQKVFWIDCDQAPDDSAPDQTDTTPGDDDTDTTPDGDDTTPDGEDTDTTTGGDTDTTTGDTTTGDTTTGDTTTGGTDTTTGDTTTGGTDTTTGGDADTTTDIDGVTEAPATGVDVPTQTPTPGDDETVVPVTGDDTDTTGGDGADDSVTTIGGTTEDAAVAGQGAVAPTVVAAAGPQAAAPAQLPFTGGQSLGALLAVGLGALGAGGFANRLGRTRYVPKHALR